MFNEIELTPFQKEIRDLTRSFAQERLKPSVREYDKKGEFPLELFRELASLGLCGVPVDKQYRGMGGDYVSFALAVEELAKVDGGMALSYAAHISLCMMPILNFGNESQKQKYLPKLASGEHIGCLGITEPEIGSDVGGTKTTATEKEDGFVLKGTKAFITNANYANTFVVTAVSDPHEESRYQRLSMFILERGFAGLSTPKKEDKLGVRTSDTGIIVLEDVFVPQENLLGARKSGFIYAMKTLDAGRIVVGALALGLAEGAAEIAINYAKQRKQFARPIASFQAIQFMIADMVTNIEAARQLVYLSARLKDAGKPFTKEASMAKLFASEIAMKVTKDAIQILGGRGFMHEYDLERFYRDAKLCTIGEGTSEIQRLIIAREILGKL